MSVFLDLLSLYEGEGLTVQTSLSAGHFPGFYTQDIPFTYMYRNGIQLAEGGGIVCRACLCRTFVRRDPSPAIVCCRQRLWLEDYGAADT